MNKVNYKQLGLSLIELLIGLFLVSLISVMLIQAYLLNKHQYLSVENKLEHSFDVQWVGDLLSNSVRSAGFTPCLSIEQLEVIDRRDSPKFIEHVAIKIKHDELQVNRMQEGFVELITIPDTRHILVSQETFFQKHNPILIADCEHAEIHQITQVEKTAQGFLLTLDASLFFNYSSVTYVGKWIEESWFIKRNKEGIPALYYKQSRSEELSPLIHSLSSEKTLVEKRQVVSIALGVDNTQIQHLKVAVRS